MCADDSLAGRPPWASSVRSPSQSTQSSEAERSERERGKREEGREEDEKRGRDRERERERAKLRSYAQRLYQVSSSESFCREIQIDRGQRNGGERHRKRDKLKKVY